MLELARSAYRSSMPEGLRRPEASCCAKANAAARRRTHGNAGLMRENTWHSRHVDEDSSNGSEPRCPARAMRLADRRRTRTEIRRAGARYAAVLLFPL